MVATAFFSTTVRRNHAKESTKAGNQKRSYADSIPYKSTWQRLGFCKIVRQYTFKRAIMELRKLGQTDVMVTPMAFGAWAIGGWMWGGAEENEAIAAIKAAYKAGITTIDTAPVYGFGRSEELVGKAMEGTPRDAYQILTKFGMNWEVKKVNTFLIL
jgi:hypothetical protein